MGEPNIPPATDKGPEHKPKHPLRVELTDGSGLAFNGREAADNYFARATGEEAEAKRRLYEELFGKKIEDISVRTGQAMEVIRKTGRIASRNGDKGVIELMQPFVDEGLVNKRFDRGRTVFSAAIPLAGELAKTANDRASEIGRQITEQRQQQEAKLKEKWEKAIKDMPQALKAVGSAKFFRTTNRAGLIDILEPYVEAGIIIRKVDDKKHSTYEMNPQIPESKALADAANERTAKIAEWDKEDRERKAAFEKAAKAENGFVREVGRDAKFAYQIEYELVKGTGNVYKVTVSNVIALYGKPNLKDGVYYPMTDRKFEYLNGNVEELKRRRARKAPDKPEGV